MQAEFYPEVPEKERTRILKETRFLEKGGHSSDAVLYDHDKLIETLKRPEVKDVRVFRLKVGTKVNVKGGRYKVVSVQKNGKATIQPI